MNHHISKAQRCSNIDYTLCRVWQCTADGRDGLWTRRGGFATTDTFHKAPVQQRLQLSRESLHKRKNCIVLKKISSDPIPSCQSQVPTGWPNNKLVVVLQVVWLQKISTNRFPVGWRVKERNTKTAVYKHTWRKTMLGVKSCDKIQCKWVQIHHMKIYGMRKNAGVCWYWSTNGTSRGGGENKITPAMPRPRVDFTESACLDTKALAFPSCFVFLHYPTSSSTTSFTNHVHFGTFPSHETYVHRSNNKWETIVYSPCSAANTAYLPFLSVL